jgi:hypothetical protein
VFLSNHAVLHSGGLTFLWIVFDGEGSYALDEMESCCFEGRKCSCDDEKDVRLHQNPGAPSFLPFSVKISKDEH